MKRFLQIFSVVFCIILADSLYALEWEQTNGPGGSELVLSLAVTENYLFAGTYGSSVFRMNISTIPIIHNTEFPHKQHSLHINTLQGKTTVSYSMPQVCVT